MLIFWSNKLFKSEVCCKPSECRPCQFSSLRKGLHKIKHAAWLVNEFHNPFLLHLCILVNQQIFNILKHVIYAMWDARIPKIFFAFFVSTTVTWYQFCCWKGDRCCKIGLQIYCFYAYWYHYSLEPAKKLNYNENIRHIIKPYMAK